MNDEKGGGVHTCDGEGAIDREEDHDRDEVKDDDHHHHGSVPRKDRSEQQDR